MQILIPLRRTALLLALLATVLTTNAQSPTFYDKVSITSPTAASLGKYGDIPVGFHTGIPEISIPLYTIKEGPLSLPISLSYHGGGGIKVGEPASWVGTGWALNAGGIITRTVIGGPDESGTTNEVYGHFSDYGYSSYWTINGAINYTTTGTAPFDYGFINNIYDGEPDLFFFNFNGYSGKFYFNDDRTPVIVDGQDLKVEYYYPRDTRPPGPSTGESNNIQGFIITVPSGDKYYFGITDNQPVTGAKPVEWSYATTDASPNNDNLTYTSWYLAKIVAADKSHAVTLTYQAEKYSVFSVAMFPQTVSVSSDQFFSPKHFALSQAHISGVRLASIGFSNGSVSLAPCKTPRADLNGYGFANPPNTEAFALKSLVVSAPDLCKRFDFSYSYFSGDNSPLALKLDSIQPGATTGVRSDRLRLKLDKVQEKSCDSTAVSGPWRFSYYSNFLPRRLSFAQDHWGFYNGQDYNNQLYTVDDIKGTLIPTLWPDSPTTGATVPGANRDAAWPAAASGLLTGIVYPTGGSTAFEYEGNDIWVNYIDNDARTLVATISGGDGVGNPQPWPVTLQLSNNPYLFKLDVYPDPNAPNGSAGLNGPGIGGLSSALGLHTQQLVRPGAGSAQYTLWVNNLGHSGYATASIYEVSPRTVQRNTLAGGGRIKTVTMKAGANVPDVVTSYSYQADGQSTGTLYSRPRYVQVVRNDLLAKWGFANLGDDGSTTHFNLLGCAGPDNAGQLFMKSPCGIVPMSTTQGNHLGYDQVTVTQAGNGRSVYFYYGSSYGKSYDDVCYRSAITTRCDPTVPSLPAPPVPFDFNRGQLKEQWSFTETGQLLKDVQYSYTYDSTKFATPGYMVREVPGGGPMLGCFYQRRGYYRKQMRVLENDVTSAGTLQTTKVYDYASPFHHQLTRQRESASAGDTLETRYSYAFDFPPPTCLSLNEGSPAYVQDCATCNTAFFNQLSSARTDAQRRRAHMDNVVCLASARKTYIGVRRIYAGVSTGYQFTHNEAKRRADDRLMPLLQLQDDYHNEPVETSKWNNHQLLGATYNTFGPGLNQPTVMYPAQQFGLFVTSPAASFAFAAVMNGGTSSIATDPRYATIPEVALKFSQGNLVEMAPRAAPVEAYLWGYNNTVPVAKTKGVNYSTLSGAYTNASANLTTMRASPALAKALVSTYVYKPLLGISSQTDPSGRTTTYEYDALGRLIRTRDEQGRILSQQQYHYAKP